MSPQQIPKLVRMEDRMVASDVRRCATTVSRGSRLSSQNMSYRYSVSNGGDDHRHC